MLSSASYFSGRSDHFYPSRLVIANMFFVIVASDDSVCLLCHRQSCNNRERLSCCIMKMRGCLSNLTGPWQSVCWLVTELLSSHFQRYHRCGVRVHCLHRLSTHYDTLCNDHFESSLSGHIIPSLTNCITDSPMVYVVGSVFPICE